MYMEALKRTKNSIRRHTVSVLFSFSELVVLHSNISKSSFSYFFMYLI